MHAYRQQYSELYFITQNTMFYQLFHFQTTMVVISKDLFFSIGLLRITLSKQLT